MRFFRKSLILFVTLLLSSQALAGVGNVTGHRWHSDGVSTISDFPVSITGGLTDSGTLIQAGQGTFQGSNYSFEQIDAPALPATAALASPAATGNVDDGDHTYVFVFETQSGQRTEISAPSNTVTVVDHTVNGQVRLTGIPVSTHPDVVNVNIFRDQDGDVNYLFVGQVSNGTTTFTDNIDNINLGAPPPTANETAAVDFGGSTTFEKNALFNDSIVTLFPSPSNPAIINGIGNDVLFPFMALRPIEDVGQTRGLWVVPDGNDFSGDLILLNERHGGGSSPVGRFDEYARYIVGSNVQSTTPDAEITVNALAPGSNYGMRIAPNAGKLALGNWIEFTNNGSASPSGTTYGFGVDNAGQMFGHFGNGAGFSFRSAGTDVAQFRQSATLNLTQAAASGGVSKWLIKATGAAISNSSASTPYNDLRIDSNRNIQFAAGNISMEPLYYFDPNATLSFTGASNITDAVGLFMRGLPQQGTNASIARSTGAMFGDYGVTGNSSNNFGVTVLQPGIGTGVGAVSTQAGLIIWNPLPVNLGNQTSTVTDLASGYFGSIAYNSTTNTRTVTRGSTLYVQGAPSNGGNVTFTNTGGPFSLFVDAGDSRFDGAILGSSASITAANNLTLGSGTTQIVSGNTQINGLSTTLSTGPAVTAGTQMILVFSGTPTVKHNTAPGAGFAKILLAGSVDLSATANTVLGVVYDGTQWQETFRKVP